MSTYSEYHKMDNRISENQYAEKRHNRIRRSFVQGFFRREWEGGSEGEFNSLDEFSDHKEETDNPEILQQFLGTDIRNNN